MVNDPTFNYDHILKIASGNPEKLSTQSAIRRLKKKYDITFTGGNPLYQWICNVNSEKMAETGNVLGTNGIQYTFQDIGNDTVRVGVPRHYSKKARELLGIKQEKQVW